MYIYGPDLSACQGWFLIELTSFKNPMELPEEERVEFEELIARTGKIDIP